VWAGRYRATVIDPARYLLDAMVFIEQHAWRSGAVQRVEDDAWSSVRHHLGLRTDPLLADHAGFWALGNTPFEREAAWRRRLEAGLSATQLQQLSEAMHKGWALAEASVLPSLQLAAGRRLAPQPRGRPKKARPPDAEDPS
jgi:putative transposase